MREYLPYIYNNLSPGGGFELEFEEDLFELFGSEDRSEEGLVGKWNPQISDFAPIRWNWSSTNLKGFVGLLYLLRRIKDGRNLNFEQFEHFYKKEIMHQRNIVQKLQREGLVSTPFRMVYTLKYRNYYFPAIIIRVQKMEWNKEEHPSYPIYITFVPEKYFVVESKTWSELNQKSHSKKYWKNHLQREYGVSPSKEIDQILGSYAFSQNLYRIMPYSLINKKLSSSTAEDGTDLLYLKCIERGERDLALTDNQLFWGLFHHITKTVQTLYSPELKADSNRYRIKNILINTLSNRTDVFRQEAGSANVLCHVLFDTFGEDYLNREFGSENTVGAKETNILKRAVKLREVASSPSDRFAETDYDYGIFLNTLGVNHTLLFSLTTGLWKKGRGKSYGDYLDQCKEMIFKTPLTTDNVTVIWYVACPETEESFFDYRVPHNSLQEMINHITSELGPVEYWSSDKGDSGLGDERAIVLSQFRAPPRYRNVRRELKNLLSSPRKTKLYSLVRHIIKNRIE